MENLLYRIPTEIYSRVSGYYRPVRYWNKGKKEEFKERKSLREVKESEKYEKVFV